MSSSSHIEVRLGFHLRLRRLQFFSEIGKNGRNKGELKQWNLQICPSLTKRRRFASCCLADHGLLLSGTPNPLSPTLPLSLSIFNPLPLLSLPKTFDHRLQTKPSFLNSYSDSQHQQQMGEKVEEKKADAGKKNDGNVTVVLKADLHCEGCVMDEKASMALENRPQERKSRIRVQKRDA